MRNLPKQLVRVGHLARGMLVVQRLWANCPLPVLILLGVSMLTNSYLYSFSGALIASSLFNTKAIAQRHSLPQTELSPAHA